MCNSYGDISTSGNLAFWLPYWISGTHRCPMTSAIPVIKNVTPKIYRNIESLLTSSFPVAGMVYWYYSKPVIVSLPLESFSSTLLSSSPSLSSVSSTVESRISTSCLVARHRRSTMVESHQPDRSTRDSRQTGWLGSVAVECWTYNREVAGSTPGRRIVE